ncbi:MAG TPA: phytanoyl-CoA dioxygenase family protein [Acidimicrobiales bacterium]|nr:phytanoyl-CoA dioxygenase family protein [Acidimicrobiales bacterium]
MTTSTQTTKLTAQEIADFDRDGFLVRRQFFTADEIGSLIRAYEEDEAISGRARAVADGQGGHTEIALWNAPGEDVFGAVARSAKLVTAVQALLRDEVYHYHSKVNLKRPHSGGTWVWHQDYGYWYNNGCLYPDMMTVGLPLSPMDKQNGCLQLIPGSNRMGRIDHLQVGEQTGADAARVQAILERVQPVAIEAEPGDAVFFHCNTLHTSDPNRSDVPRNLLLIAYNAKHNDPYREGPHPRYTPLDVLPDEEIMQRSHLRDGEARVFSKE